MSSMAIHVHVELQHVANHNEWCLPLFPGEIWMFSKDYSN
jgi:hypothetical protein